MTETEKRKHIQGGKKLVFWILLAVCFFIIAGTALNLWFGKNMKSRLARQFNQQQLIIAHNIKRLIERELAFLQKEISLISSEIPLENDDPIKLHSDIRKSLSRILQSGVRRVEIADLVTGQSTIFTSQKYWIMQTRNLEIPVKFKKAPDTEHILISSPRIDPSGITLRLYMHLRHDSTKIIVFNVNISWFLTPFLKDIRSGKTGYPWIIDQKGNFLFHPNTDFLGKNAFSIRALKNPDLSYSKINFIQKNNMLKGQEGMSSYVSNWHRGITGRINKLIAYCPIIISDNPSKNWSVAVVAPVSEIEEEVQKRELWQLLMQGIIIAVIILASVIILAREMKWTKSLEKKVSERTEELKRSEGKYRSLVESAEDFIFTLDLAGNFQALNSYTANFFGGYPDEFIGKNASLIFTGKSSRKLVKMFQLVCTHGKSLRDEFEFQTGDHQMWINANFMPIRNEDGHVISVLCIARDITEDKTLEMQLVNTEKLASLGTLAAGVAHEINNPLGVILGFCDLLIRKKETGSQEFEDLKTIERQGLHCKQIVENLLHFSRLGKTVSEYSNLNQCIEEITLIVKHTLEMDDIELAMELGHDIPLVKGDSRELQQVFLNLINNAVAAMKDGGILKIHSFFSPKTHRAVVQFIDNGTGIKKKDMDHIFEPFFTTKPEGEGTGLGLSVSYGIINQYGGTIEGASHDTGKEDRFGRKNETVFTIKMLTGESI